VELLQNSTAVGTMHGGNGGLVLALDFVRVVGQP